MFSKLVLYVNTVKSMRVSQIYYRVCKVFQIGCSIGCKVTSDVRKADSIVTVRELDYDPSFLKRFPANEFVNNKVTFLHSSKIFQWDEKWHFDDESALWNFNLHYFEFLFSLVDAYKKSGEKEYLEKTIEAIRGWINQNPKEKGGEGWSPYTIALRLTNWLSYYAAVGEELDNSFQEMFIKSIHEQYEFLSRHLEKYILGNHYFEDLKTLVLCAVFFRDEPVLKNALKAFLKECKEEILPDGMHFELSPMYHKLILEGVIRVGVALKGMRLENIEVNSYLQPMLDAAWSMEEGLERIPLFNDSGNNVAKSLSALVLACKQHFDLMPKYRSRFEDSGFYIFKQGTWKLIVDAGQPGPSYIPGHAHCDAMSFELFNKGEPVIVNCGTYAYQCQERAFFRSTAAHNTVKVNDTEQSQCWGAFRLAKRASVIKVSANEEGLIIEMEDYKKNNITRSIQFGHNELHIRDMCNAAELVSYLHICENKYRVKTSARIEIQKNAYSEEYGKKGECIAMRLYGANVVDYTIEL